MPDFGDFMDNEFDDRVVKPSTGQPEPVPPGRYTLQLEKGSMEYTKAGTGIMFKCVFAILGGEYEGRAVYASFNIRNNSVQAQTIGVSELKALAAATGQDWEKVRGESDLLLYKPFQADLGMERENINPTTGQPYPPRNRITRYIMKDKGVTSPAPARQAPATATATAKVMRPVSDLDKDVPF